MTQQPDIPKIEALTGWPIHEAWDKYESVAMHFNDLLMRLRTQALGAVVAISTLTGVVTTSGIFPRTSWGISFTIFSLLAVAWLAVWILDFCYYNRLLIGAVTAILELEEKSRTTSHISHINLSTRIHEAAGAEFLTKSRISNAESRRRIFGRWFFYASVFCVLLACALWSLNKHLA